MHLIGNAHATRAPAKQWLPQPAQAYEVISQPPPGQFDPARGCQRAWTGILGGCFAVALVVCYGFYKQVVPGGGPQVQNVFWWIPFEVFRFRVVNRDFFDLFAILFLSFQMMVAWEFARARWQRGLVVLVSLALVWWAYQLSQGATLFLNQAFMSIGAWLQAGYRPALGSHSIVGLVITRMEVLLALGAAAYFALWLLNFPAWRRQLKPAPLDWVFRTSLARWASGLAAIFLVMVVFFTHPFWSTNTFYENARISIVMFFSLYAVLGLPYALLTNRSGSTYTDNVKDPGFVFYMLLAQVASRRWGKLRQSITNRRTLIALRDLLVKLFFVPIMIGFFLINCGNLMTQLPATANPLPVFSPRMLFDRWYYILFNATCLLDVSLGLIGYLAASRWLGNKSVSVEPTLGGWVVAIFCYPPFNGITGGYLPYDRNFGGLAYFDFGHIFSGEAAAACNIGLDVLLKCLTLALFVIYAWATTAFGLRFSNLTNRGVITVGPYRWIRHPAYITKNLAWWTEHVRTFSSPWQFLLLLGTNVLYTLRALTEERHMLSDPNYQAYCQRVRWRYIPGIW